MAAGTAELTAGSTDNQLLLAAESGFTPANIPGIRKAAILLLSVGDELGKKLMQGLGEDEVQRVTDEITKVESVTPQVATQVLTEFYGLLETQQYMVRGGADYAMKLLTEAFGSQRAATMLQQVKGMQERTAGDLAMLQKMDPQQLSKFLENEHPQTVALVLAHLDAKRGAVLLMCLQESLRVQAVQRLAEMRQFSPEMAQKVAIILHRKMKALGSTGRRSYAGFKAVADLLNRLDQSASKGILEEIEQKQPQIAIGIRTLMFTFDDLLTVPPASIREIVGGADKKMLAIALKGAKENIRAHLFSAMSSRAVEMMKEDIEVMGPIRMKDVTTAQLDILNLAQKLEAEGKIMLKMEPTMQSPSDQAAAASTNGHGGRAVARVFGDEGKGIARLEFEAVEEADTLGTRNGGLDVAARLKQEIATLEAELQQQSEALPAKLDEARRLARLLARRDWEQEMEQRLAEDRAMVMKACDDFARERTRYFAAVEAQVVKLSLAIATRVLHREARMDPLLLSGAVRVALEKVEEESETRLRVPMNEVAMWATEFEAANDGAVRVVGDDGMARGECVLETSVGTVELGIEAQLGEIERGFFDLMQRRPA